MSAKTKIVVVKMKHVILTGVLLGILLLLIIFAATYFFSGDEPKPAVEETGMYTPGVYNTSGRYTFYAYRIGRRPVTLHDIWY